MTSGSMDHVHSFISSLPSTSSDFPSSLSSFGGSGEFEEHSIFSLFTNHILNPLQQAKKNRSHMKEEEEDTKKDEIGEKMVVEGYMEIEDSTFHNSNFRLALLENVTFDQCDLSCELI